MTTATVVEQPVFVTVGDDMLFAVHSQPAKPRGVGVILIHGGDTVNVSLRRNDLTVRLARALAADGYDVVRFDYHGLGESTGTAGEYHLERPFSGDAVAVAGYLRSRGIDQMVLTGACFSSRTALAGAQLIEETRAVLMATPPSAGYQRRDAIADRMARDASLGEYARRGLSLDKVKGLLTDPHRRSIYAKLVTAKLRTIARTVKARLGGGDELYWVSPTLVAGLEDMAKRQIPVTIVFGTDDPLLREFRRAMGGKLGRVIRSSGGSIRLVDDIPGIVHGFPSVSVQEAFFRLAIDWVPTVAPGSGPDRRQVPAS